MNDHPKERPLEASSPDRTVMADLYKAQFDYVPADGVSSATAVVDAKYTGPDGDSPWGYAYGVDVHLDVTGGDAAELQIWYDPQRTKPVVDNTVTIGKPVAGVTDGTAGWLRLYLTCSARAARTYTITATPDWPGGLSDQQTWHFVAPPFTQPEDLDLAAMNGTDVVNLTTPRKTTPVIVKVTSRITGQPMAKVPVSGKLVLTSDLGRWAGEVELGASMTDESGLITAYVYPAIDSKVTLVLTDERTGGQGGLALSVRTLYRIDISAQPDPVRAPGKITFSADIQDNFFDHQPGGVALKWTAGDDSSEKYFAGSQKTTTDHDVPATFEFTTAVPVTQDDLDHDSTGHVATELLVYGTDTPFILPYMVSFQPATSQTLPPPMAYLGTLITDDLLEQAAALGGVPFGIPAPPDAPTDGSGYVIVWAHVKAGPLDPTDGGDLRLQEINIPSGWDGKAIPFSIRVDSTIFQQDWNADLYYTLSYGNAGPSRVLPLVVDRDSLKNPQPDSRLPAPHPSTLFYEKYDADQDIVWAVTIKCDFPQSLPPPAAGDKVWIKIDLTGAAFDNVNRRYSFGLPVYTVTTDDVHQASPYVILTFDRKSGDHMGFTADYFKNRALFDAEIYYLYLPTGSSQPLRSPSRRAYLDTVDDYPPGAVKLMVRQAGG